MNHAVSERKVLLICGAVSRPCANLVRGTVRLTYLFKLSCDMHSGICSHAALVSDTAVSELIEYRNTLSVCSKIFMKFIESLEIDQIFFMVSVHIGSSAVGIRNIRIDPSIGFMNHSPVLTGRRFCSIEDGQFIVCRSLIRPRCRNLVN